mmetsp:Transcript_15613/g.33183  ORF Transcript_15613/g.33183 Transcript_15613/m.33183 type:complete len:200 (+) Transcript_15613:2477-3076(+)
MDVVPDSLRHLMQKICARRDDVGVEELTGLTVRQCLPLCLPVSSQLGLLTFHLLALLRGTEASSPLLIHLRARSHAVNSHVHKLLGAYDSEETVQVQEDVLIHVLLILRRRPILRMAARVNDAIHIQVEVVEVTVRRILIEVHGHHTTIHLHWLPLDGVPNDLRVAHTEPSEEGRDAHRVGPYERLLVRQCPRSGAEPP